MAVFGMAITVCFVLAKKYPEGYSLEELYAEVRQTALWIPNPEWLEEAILGSEGGRPHRSAAVACWKRDSEGKIYFDPNAERYSNYDNEHFKETIEKWFIKQGLEKRRLNQGD